ncbi:MAG TPA: outer membrane protein assembly factor BamD [Polyangiaceae bacterium]|nr:outer membrane protein assembly factor BamD [Polyangiaceae bacterium]
MLVACGTAAATGGCGGGAGESRGALHYTEDAKRAYDKAMVAFQDHDWEEAKALFKDVKKKYSYSRYARLAELRLADTDYASEKLAESITSYRSFVHDHRIDPEVPYARFRICKALFDQISDGGFLLPPLEERDQATTTEAYKELSSFVKDYGAGPYTDQARYMLAIITGRLVRHELYVAKYYLRRDKFEAAAARAQYALRTYDGSGLEPETMVLLGETYLKMHKPAEAKSTFSQVLAKYPASAFSTAAKNFLLEIESQGK